MILLLKQNMNIANEVALCFANLCATHREMQEKQEIMVGRKSTGNGST